MRQRARQQGAEPPMRTAGARGEDGGPADHVSLPASRGQKARVRRSPKGATSPTRRSARHLFMKCSARPIISRPGWRPPRRSLTKHGSRNAARPNTLGGIADSFKKASIRCNRLRSIIFSLTALNDRTTRPIGYFLFERRFLTCLGKIRLLKTK